MDKIEKAFFRVVGMYCTSCKPIVEKQLKNELAVKKIGMTSQNGSIEKSQVKEKQGQRDSNNKSLYRQESNKLIKKGLRIKLNCEFCKGPILAGPHVYRFANYERFFCCTECLSSYKKKYAGRIESIKRRFKEKRNSSL